AELVVIAQSADVPDRADERFLDEIETRLLVMHQFEYIHIQRELVAFEEDIPGFGVSSLGLRHGQLFSFSHYQHLQPVECRRREKVQWEEGKNVQRPTSNVQRLKEPIQRKATFL